MTEQARTKTGDHLAILIDGDNVSSKIIAGLMNEVTNYGTASVRRIYGDWTSPHMKSWRECLLEHSIVPIQQFAYTTGKNATDGAMLIDAMDLMYTGRFSSFCLVSSDSDFTRLAARIREQGITVYGFGNRDNTHRSFIAACNEFVYFDALSTQTDEPIKATIRTRSPTAKATATTSNNYYMPPQYRGSLSTSKPATQIEQPKKRPLDKAALDAIRTAIQGANPYEGDYVELGVVGSRLVKLSPDLNARNYGYERLREFVEASGIVEVKMSTSLRSATSDRALVRLRRRC